MPPCLSGGAGGAFRFAGDVSRPGSRRCCTSSAVLEDWLVYCRSCQPFVRFHGHPLHGGKNTLAHWLIPNNGHRFLCRNRPRLRLIVDRSSGAAHNRTRQCFSRSCVRALIHTSHSFRQYVCDPFFALNKGSHLAPLTNSTRFYVASRLSLFADTVPGSSSPPLL